MGCDAQNSLHVCAEFTVYPSTASVFVLLDCEYLRNRKFRVHFYVSGSVIWGSFN